MTRCSRCGTELPRPDEACPRCLLELALSSDPGRGALPSPTDPTLSLASAPTLDAPPDELEVRPRSVRTAFETGARLGPYALVRPLGRGGFGEVWEAEDERDQRRVALKLLTEDLSREARERFRREGRIAASIHHPRVVFLFTAEELDGVPALAMELAPGGTLQDLVANRGPLPWREAVERILELVEGLEAAHERGILHRDIKPSNCFLDEEGRAKVGDFGLSIPTEGGDDHTKTGTYVGTPAFSSPEQVRGRRLDLRSDLFSLGATLHFLLGGRVPFGEGSLGQILARVLAEPPAPLSTHGAELPPGLERVVLKLMAKDPADRPASYAAVRSLLFPYSSRRLGAADLGLRVVAHFVDSMVVMGSLWALETLCGLAPESVSEPASLARILARVAALFSYYVLFERWAGRTPGKAITGLAVRAVDGAPISTRAALVRSAVFVTLGNALSMAAVYFLAERLGAVFVLGALGDLALFVPMRRATGFRGLHEQASGTRVTHEPLWARDQRVLAPTLAGRLSPALPAADLPARLGPFEVQGVLAIRPGSKLLLGHDPVLRRDVWISLQTDSAEPASAPFEPESVERRFWRLQSGCHGAAPWDAYAALEGGSLLAWVASAGPRPWTETSRVLAKLALALDGASSKAAPLSLRSVWVTPRVEIRCLPFDAPGAPVGLMTETYAPSDWRALLLDAAIWLLEGRSAGGDRRPRRPLPIAYREALERLGSGHAGSPREFAEFLSGLPKLPTEVTRVQRLASFVLSSLPIVAFTLTHLARRDLEVAAHSLGVFRLWISIAMWSLSPPALLALVFPALLRSGGLSLGLAGIELVRRDGFRASRVRRLLRAVVAWSPVLLAWYTPWGGRLLAPPALALFFGGVLFALAYPSRGLQDRIAGTVLVPRS